MAQRLPIIYVRGFAGGTSGINAAVDDPFYGFNEGSTHVRVGGRGEPVLYQFESPLLRLMLDHKYDLFVEGGQLQWLENQTDGTVPEHTIWVHRFYDVSASTYGETPADFTPERAARDLLKLVELVRVKTGAPRVHLVAHSMGGLICRCLIQRIIPEERPNLEASDFVDRFFTYATPHGGIEFDVGFGMLERVRDTFGIGGGEIFGPKRMYEYLNPGGPTNPPSGWKPQDMPDKAFPKERMLSLIGTNPGDYAAAKGLSSKAVGAKSDGLVQIENAYVPGAKFAFVHRSHSGRYGIVNSEEGYQNLRRFLLGDLEVQADLVNLRLPQSDDGSDLIWQAEVELAVRGLPVLLHQQTAAQHCPIVFDAKRDTADRPLPLVTTFLIAAPDLRPRGQGPARYTLQLRVLSLRQGGGMFDFGDHLEQVADFDDALVVDVGEREGRLVAWAAWNSELPRPLRDYEPTGKPCHDTNPAPGIWVTNVALPKTARQFLGGEVAVRLTVTDRNGHGREGLKGAGANAVVSAPGPERTRPATSTPPAKPGNVMTRTLRRLFSRNR